MLFHSVLDWEPKVFVEPKSSSEGSIHLNCKKFDSAWDFELTLDLSINLCGQDITTKRFRKCFGLVFPSKNYFSAGSRSISAGSRGKMEEEKLYLALGGY
jgi:hypothetical protein